MTNTAQKIAATLNETERVPLAIIRRVVKVLGEDRALGLLDQTLTIEAEGGLKTDDGSRRRTCGGVFFKLVKSRTTLAERRLIFYPRSKKKKKAAPPISREELQQLAEDLLRSPPGEAGTVKMTLVGRPGRIVEKGTVVLTGMPDSKAPSLPKGLPEPPGDPSTYLIFIALKQWREVKDSLNRNSTDKLIVEGYPFFDERIGQHGAMTVYAQSVTTTLIQRASREAQQSAAES